MNGQVQSHGQGEEWPKPGSEEAQATGCLCPVYDNARGAGILGLGERFGWWITADCPLHGAQSFRAKTSEAAQPARAGAQTG